ncbi:MAG TPA: hypothetical protein VK638_22435, partial [Edaphobacter sp.]|nr:hypothetical protein [Edaphobacter sp.]
MRNIAGAVERQAGSLNPSGFPPLCRYGCQDRNLQDEAGKSVADAHSLRAEVSPGMMSRRFLSIFLFALAFVGRLPAQVAAPQLQPTSPQPSSEPHTIAMTVPNGTPLQIALDKEVRVRKVGEPITGRVMQPVYVFDRLVIPVGTAANGRISAIDPISGS